jgi:beta-lactamase class A
MKKWVNIKMKKLRVILVLVLLIGISMVFGCELRKNEDSSSRPSKETVIETPNIIREEKVDKPVEDIPKDEVRVVAEPSNIIVEEPKVNVETKVDVEPKVNGNVEPKDKNISKLESELSDLCNDKGEWSIYIKDLKSGEELFINNKKMVAASIIKLFIMGKVYEAIDEGVLEKDRTLDDLLKSMITISDNASSNKLVELLGVGSHEKGLEKVNDFAKTLNCLDTELQRKFYDSGPPPKSKENYTSVEDCGRILEKIYNKQCVSEDYDREMLALLLAQERNSKLPSLLPEGVKVAHKTGELSNVENDVGIVFAPKTDYIICVMSNELYNPEMGRKLVAEISKVVYDYFDIKDNVK